MEGLKTAKKFLFFYTQSVQLCYIFGCTSSIVLKRKAKSSLSFSGGIALVSGGHPELGKVTHRCLKILPKPKTSMYLWP